MFIMIALVMRITMTVITVYYNMKSLNWENINTGFYRILFLPPIINNFIRAICIMR